MLLLSTARLWRLPPRARHFSPLIAPRPPPLLQPVPSFNIINGGVHAGNALAFQVCGCCALRAAHAGGGGGVAHGCIAAQQYLFAPHFPFSHRSAMITPAGATQRVLPFLLF